MTISHHSTVSFCLCALSADPKHSLTCLTKVSVGLKPQSAGVFGVGKPNVNVDFHSRVHKSLSVRTSSMNPAQARISMMPIGTPRVPYRTPGEGTWQWVDLWNALYRERVIFIGQHIDEEFSNQVLATMLYLDSIESSKRLHLYINGPGGDEDSEGHIFNLDAWKFYFSLLVAGSRCLFVELHYSHQPELHVARLMIFAMKQMNSLESETTCLGSWL